MKGRPLYDLPEAMEPIIDAIGRSAALSLVHVYPGAELYIPKPDNLTEEHPLAAFLGMPLAKRLAERFGGDVLDVPVCHRMLDAARAAQVVAALHAGVSVAEVTRRFGVTIRAVRLMKARHRARVEEA